MAEDPRHLLHFATKAKFEQKLADGTVSANRHLAFIKDANLIWCRGLYYNDISDLVKKVDNHIANASNPHSVTKTQVGLGNVTNESKTTMFTSPSFTGTPVAPTAATSTNNTQIATTEFVKNAIAEVVANADSDFDTLKEIADWISSHKNDASAMNTQITANTNAINNLKYAGASTAGGSATSAVKLDTTTAGSATQPCYFADGKPSACTYTLGTSVPSDAKFTDTNTTYSAGTGLSLSGTTFSLNTAGTNIGGVKTATTGTTANRDYNVLINSDGTMKVNVPWTDTNTNTTYSKGDGLLLTGTTFSIDFARENTWTGYQNFTGGAGNSSDIRYKINIKPLDNVLDKVKQLDIFNYTWKREGDPEYDTFGVSAQQLEKLGFNKIVHSNENNIKSVEYDHLGVIALKAIQELLLEVHSLKNEIAELKNGK